MAKLSDNAQKVWDRLSEDGEKVGGITLQRELDLTKVEYMRARDELKEENLVEVGGGRGGSLARREGAEIKTGPSKQEIMAMAREAKVAKNQDRKERNATIEKIVNYCHKAGYPQVETKDVSFSEGRPIIAIWDGPGAQMHTIPTLEFDKLMAQAT